MLKNYRKIHDTSTVTVPDITRANVKFVCYPFDNNFFGIHKEFDFLVLNFVVFILLKLNTNFKVINS